MPPSGQPLGAVAQQLVAQKVEDLFDRLKARFLGPKYLPVDKRIIITGWAPELTLPGVFRAAAASEGVRADDHVEDTLAGIASRYLDAVRERTKAQVLQAVTTTLRQALSGGVKTDVQTVLGGQLSRVWADVSHQVETIIDAETQTAKGMGVLEGITRINAHLGVEDPVVYFMVVHDDLLCKECRRLHLLPDGVTPRVWLLSEVKTGYHKRGEDTPSVSGLHPHCFTGGMRLHTRGGMPTLEELFRRGQQPVDVAVDARVKNRRVPANQFGVDVPGDCWLDQHVSGVVWRHATHVYDTGMRPCVRFTLEGGRVLEVSEDHDVWIDDDGMGKKVAAKEVRVGDKMPLLSGKAGFGGDHFPVEAELMGNLMGDGVPHVRWGSLALGRRFVREFGLTKKPRRVPARLWTADEETVAAFLRGLYAADGHSEVAPVVVLSQNDLEFLREIQVLLSNFGLRALISPHGDGGQKAIVYANGASFETRRRPCWRLHLGGWSQVSDFARDIGMGVPRKQEQLLQRLAATEEKASGGWRTARVVAVEPLGVQQTYCLTEPHTNTLTVNGIVTGNCRCTMGTLMTGYGFKGGRVEYIRPDWNELEHQRHGSD